MLKNKMDILIHSRKSCDRCYQAMELCDRAGLEYTVRETEPDEMLKMYPNFAGNAYPYVIIDGKEIGDLLATAKFFLREGLVSVPE